MQHPQHQPRESNLNFSSHDGRRKRSWPQQSDASRSEDILRPPAICPLASVLRMGSRASNKWPRLRAFVAATAPTSFVRISSPTQTPPRVPVTSFLREYLIRKTHLPPRFGCRRMKV